MTQQLEYLSILNLTAESDRQNDVLDQIPTLQTEISNWSGERSQVIKKATSPLLISNPTSKAQISVTYEDEYNFIDSFEKLHRQDVNQLKANQFMENSLKHYSETKRSKEFNGSIRITVSPEFATQSDFYTKTRTANQSPQANGAITTQYQNSLRDFSGERVSDKVMRLKNNARRIIHDNMTLSKNLLNTRRKSKQLTTGKLKQKLILIETGLEELNRANEYKRTHQLSRDVRERSKLLDMYISPKVNPESRSSSNETVSKKLNNFNTGSRIRRSGLKHHLFYNLK